MRYAYRDRRDEFVLPTPGATAVCFGCGESVFAKCGDIVGDHWCHHSGSVCVHAKTEPETAWHSGWKSEVPRQFREVTVRKDNRVKRADIRARTATVIELQHSEISTGELKDREDHYGRNFFWMFDSDGRRRSINKSSLGNAMKYNGFEQREVVLAESVPGVGNTGRVTLVDLGSDIARVLPHPTNTGRRFQAIIANAEEVRGHVRQTCDEANPLVAGFLRDTMTDWMTEGKRRKRVGGHGKSDGRYVRAFCDSVSDAVARIMFDLAERDRWHEEWMRQQTEKGSRNYYEEGW